MNEYYNKSDFEENKWMAMLSYINVLVLIPMFFAKDSYYARFHANQGLILFIFSVVSTFAVRLLLFVTSVINYIPVVGTIISSLMNIVSGAVGVVVLILAIIGIVNALTGKTKELPVIGRFNILK